VEGRILGNLRLPAFQAAWSDVEPHLPADFFDDLRDLIKYQLAGVRERSVNADPSGGFGDVPRTFPGVGYPQHPILWLSNSWIVTLSVVPYTTGG